jgi:hypothetical protein
MKEYSHTPISSAAEIGFRYIAFTGRERQLSLHGSGLENIVYVKVVANGKIIGEGAGNNAIRLKKVSFSRPLWGGFWKRRAVISSSF